VEKSELCRHCQKNPATISRKDPLTGADVKEYYCSSCYQSLFLTRDFSTDKSLVIEVNGQKACAVCKRTAREFFATGLLGCANCYKALAKEVYPTILKMQGDRAHCGNKHVHSEQFIRLLDERDALRSDGEAKAPEEAEKLEYLVKRIGQSSKSEEEF